MLFLSRGTLWQSMCKCRQCKVHFALWWQCTPSCNSGCSLRGASKLWCTGDSAVHHEVEGWGGGHASRGSCASAPPPARGIEVQSSDAVQWKRCTIENGQCTVHSPQCTVHSAAFLHFAEKCSCSLSWCTPLAAAIPRILSAENNAGFTSTLRQGTKHQYVDSWPSSN